MQKDRAKASFKGLLTSAQLPRLISLGSYEKFQPSFRDGKRPKILGTKSWPNTKNLTFGPIIASVTLKAVSLQLNGMLTMWKIQRAMQDEAIRTARIHPAVHPGNRDEVFIWQNSQHAYWDLGNRASPPSHMSTSKMLQRISREGEIWETGQARSTGIIWSIACEQALHLGEQNQSREGDTREKWRECPWSWRKTDVKIQFPFQVIAFAFNLSVHHPALSKVKACRLGLSCFQLLWRLLENLIGNYHQSVNSIYPPQC